MNNWPHDYFIGFKWCVNNATGSCGWAKKLLFQIVKISVPVSPDLVRCLSYFDELLQQAYFASGNLVVCSVDLFQQIEKHKGYWKYFHWKRDKKLFLSILCGSSFSRRSQVFYLNTSFWELWIKSAKIYTRWSVTSHCSMKSEVIASGIPSGNLILSFYDRW